MFPNIPGVKTGNIRNERSVFGHDSPLYSLTNNNAGIRDWRLDHTPVSSSNHELHKQHNNHASWTLTFKNLFSLHYQYPTEPRHSRARFAAPGLYLWRLDEPFRRRSLQSNAVEEVLVKTSREGSRASCCEQRGLQDSEQRVKVVSFA